MTERIILKPEDAAVESGLTLRQQLEGATHNHETEEYLPISVITISGRSGTGKTKTAQYLKEYLEGIGKKVKLVKVGEEMIRKPHFEATGEEVLGTVALTTLERDRRIEQEQIALMRAATPDEILILEGWTSAFAAKRALREAKKEKKPLAGSILKILLTTPSKTRLNRTYDRQKEKNHRLTKRRAVIETVQRERDNHARWSKIYPQMQGIDPWGKANRNNRGNPIYDQVIDTEIPKPEQVAYEIFKLIEPRIKIQDASKKIETGEPQIAPQGVIFTA